MQKFRLAALLFFSAGSSMISSVYAQDKSANMLDVHGSLSAGVWSGDRILSDQNALGFAKLQLQANGQWDSSWSWKTNGVITQHENASEVEQSKSWQTHLRDAYLNWNGDQTEWKIGTQTFSWGRADRTNPTDNLSARDFTSPFVTDDEQRLGSLSSSLSQYLGVNTRLNLIAQKVRKSIYPSDRLEQGYSLVPIAREYDYAVKLEQTGDDIDWSLSYFDGIEKTRSLSLIQSAGALRGVQREYKALQVIGADAAASSGNWSFRGETAYLRFKPTLKPELKTSAGRLSHWYTVFGVENNLGNNASISAQYFFRRFDKDPNLTDAPAVWRPSIAKLQVANNQLHQWQDGFTLRFAQRLMNDQLDYEIVAMSNLRDKDFVLRPRLNYRYSDAIKWTFGGDLFQGKDHSFFGSLKKNSLALAELVFIF